MTRWRETPKGDEEKPLLEAVLLHYGVQVPRRQVFMTACPFHSDATPSLSVNLNLQVFMCHSCSRGGDSYALIMAKEDCGYQRARTTATDLGLASGSARGSGDSLSGGRYERSRPLPDGKGDRPEPSRWRSPRSRDE